MNGKKARMLRKTAQFLATADVHTETQYIKEQHPDKYYYTGKINSEGLHEKERYTPIQLKLSNCERNIYKQLKNNYKNNNFLNT